MIELGEDNVSMQVAWKKLFDRNFKYKQIKFGTSKFEGLELTGYLVEQSRKLKSTDFNIAEFIDKNDIMNLFKTNHIALVVNLESEKMILKNYQSDADDDRSN